MNQTRSSDNRSEETRQKLVAAGLGLFSARGYDGVTTRELAQRAGVNQAAIPYHFGGKEGVYLAVAEHIGEMSRERLTPLLSQTRAALAKDTSPAAVGHLLTDFLCGLARLMLEPPLPMEAFGFLLREQMQPGPAFDLLYRSVMDPVHGLCGELCATLTGQSAASPENILLEHALIGQVMGFLSGRSGLLRRLGREDVEGDEVAEVIRRLVAGFAVSTGTTHRSSD